tara:strand:+ start:570 stop:1016 length:447 start_codon:yes stop_codon:yes gene_type:complete
MKYAVHYNGDSEHICITNFNEKRPLPLFLKEHLDRGECLFYDEIPDELELHWLSCYDIDFKELTVKTNHKRLIEKVIKSIRARRDEALTKLDTEQMKCSGDDQKLARLYEVKQRLRDLPDTINFDVVRTTGEASHVDPPILTTYMYEI